MSYNKLYLDIQRKFGIEIKKKFKKYIESEDFDYDDFMDLVKTDDIDDIDVPNKNDVCNYLKEWYNNSINIESEVKGSDDDAALNEYNIKHIINAYTESTKIDKKNTAILIQNVCPSMWPMDDQTLKDAVHISLQFGDQYTSLLNYLVDDYTRCYVEQYILDGSQLTVAQWGKDRLMELNDQLKKTLINGVTGFFNRVNQSIILPIQMKINDNINDYVKMTLNIIEFIKKIKASNSPNIVNQLPMPMQFDFWIIPNAVSNTIINNGDSDDDSKSSNSGYDREPSYSGSENNGDAKPFDKFGELLDDFKGNEYVSKNLNLSDQISRDISNAFKQLMMKYCQNIYNTRLKRFVCVFDRTIKYDNEINNDNNKNNKNKNTFMFIPKKNSKIPKDFIPETFIELSKYIISIKNGNTTTEIGVNDGIGGHMFCISFHIISNDIIKCYLYSNTKMMRFYPNDIIKIWPKFFVNNKSTIDDELLDSIQNIDPQNILNDKIPFLPTNSD